MPAYVEHANLTVRDLEGVVEFLTTALPEFSVRGRGEGEDRLWAHVGTTETYIALEQPTEPGSAERRPYVDPGINHVGLVVEDAEQVRRRLTDAGYREGIRVPDHAARRRVYFFDPDGNEYEFIEYTSEDPGQRNAYDAPAPA